jgi:hypothetical protein
MYSCVNLIRNKTEAFCKDSAGGQLTTEIQIEKYNYRNTHGMRQVPLSLY